MSKSGWDVASATRCIIRNGGTVKGNVITLGKSRGLKILGAVDYLVKHNRYIHVKTEGR